MTEWNTKSPQTKLTSAPLLVLLPLRRPLLPVETTSESPEERNLTSEPSPLPDLKIESNCGKFILGVSGGMGFSYRTLQSSVHHQLVEHKNQSEHGTTSYSAGVYGVINLIGSVGIKTGLTYLKVGERYHFENDHATHATTNTYEYYNIDLKYNQNLVCNGRFRLDAAIGTKVNLLRTAHSSWLDPNTFEAVDHTNQGQHSPFRDRNLVWSDDLTGYFFIGRNAFVGLTVEADRFQNSIYKDAVQLEQRPYAFQGYLNLGVKF